MSRTRIPVALRGEPVPGQEDRIQPGQAVMALDAAGRWHEAVATSGVIYGHDFEVVWINKVYGGSRDGVPFPAEDILTLDAYALLPPEPQR